VSEGIRGSIVSEDINEVFFSGLLSTAGIADPDLVIRTAGEHRLSNFLLWQSAYSELYFCPKFWPDFEESDLETALENFHSRTRKYGGLVDPSGDSSHSSVLSDESGKEEEILSGLTAEAAQGEKTR